MTHLRPCVSVAGPLASYAHPSAKVMRLPSEARPGAAPPGPRIQSKFGLRRNGRQTFEQMST